MCAGTSPRIFDFRTKQHLRVYQDIYNIIISVLCSYFLILKISHLKIIQSCLSCSLDSHKVRINVANKMLCHSNTLMILSIFGFVEGLI
jgi:hypothetical protein